MSMILEIRKISDAELGELRRNPDRAGEFLSADDDVAPVSDDGADARLIDLDKAWQGLHFLFTETAGEGSGPASYLLNGTPIGDANVTGYGPPLSLDSNAVAAFEAFLRTLNEDALRKRFQPQEMQDQVIYPGIWEDDDAFDYLMEHFTILKAFVASAAKQKSALLIYLT